MSQRRTDSVAHKASRPVSCVYDLPGHAPGSRTDIGVNIALDVQIANGACIVLCYP